MCERGLICVTVLPVAEREKATVATDVPDFFQSAWN